MESYYGKWFALASTLKILNKMFKTFKIEGARSSQMISLARIQTHTHSARNTMENGADFALKGKPVKDNG